MMIFLAGLQGIPRDQYEAASVDGATKFKQFLYITLPGLKGTIKYVIMITMIQAMKLFTQPYIMTQGGPKTPPRPWYITFIPRASREVISDTPAPLRRYSLS